jgi:hypothetical protein
MSTGEVLYLALVIVAFLAFSGILFATMLTAGGETPDERAAHHHGSPHH